MLVSLYAENKNSGAFVTKGEATRARILVEALRLFADKGFEATTMNDIASAVGIKAASLYAHFSGKDELFRSVFESALSTWKDLVDGLFAKAEVGSDLGSTLESILGDFALALKGSVAYRFWARLYVFPPPGLSREDWERMCALDQSFAERVASICAAGLARKPSADELGILASSLSYFTMGIMMYASLMDEPAIRAELRKGVAFHLKSFSA